jgi:DNA-binding NtrC family response regulator
MCTAEGYGTEVRILIANWDRNYALSLAAAMHQAGLTTITAFNGKEAVEKAETFRPHLLVTEAYLGRLSGIHAAVCITAALPGCKVLFVSGEASFADIANAAPEGLAFSYARKPVHPVNLFNAIASMLSSEWPVGHSERKKQDKSRPAVRQKRVRGDKAAAATRKYFGAAIFKPALL